MKDELYGYICPYCGHLIAYHNTSNGPFPDFDCCDVCGVAVNSCDMKNWKPIKKD